MKKISALLLTLGLMMSGSAFAVGAIAVDDHVGETDPAYGFATGHETKEIAQKRALKECRKYGDNCKVIVWFETCGAYAASKRHYGYGYGASLGTAKRNALKMCGRDSCEIIVAECE